jgi:TusA-related sulfurtransferase
MRLQKVLKAGLQYSDQPGEDILLVTDHSCVHKSIGEFCQARKLSFLSEEVQNGVWELYISRPKG